MKKATKIQIDFFSVLLLLGCGGLLGLSTNMAKVASSNGFSTFTFLFWSLLGASVLINSSKGSKFK